MVFDQEGRVGNLLLRQIRHDGVTDVQSPPFALGLFRLEFVEELVNLRRDNRPMIEEAGTEFPAVAYDRLNFHRFFFFDHACFFFVFFFNTTRLIVSRKTLQLYV